MPFESLSFRYSFRMSNFPERWLPLIHLYDPDLPLFPIYYFHVLPEGLPENHRPQDNERAFGYVERLNISDSDSADVTIVTNKNLEIPANRRYLIPVVNDVNERFGVSNSVTMSDIESVFSPPLDDSNNVLSEIWQRVVSNAYGNLLPFGRLWDETLGLARFMASWYSPSGRKGELIQTHYFASRFGVRIQSAGHLPQVDFFLLPNIKELTDHSNPLVSFPEYSKLVRIAREFQHKHCSTITFEGVTLSKFRNPSGGSFNTERIMTILNSTTIPQDCRELAIECFNAFNKGPQRTVIFLMLLDDVRLGRIDLSVLNSAQCGSIYDALRGASTYQSPKAIEIYAQQSFGNPSAMPIDTWIETFFKWPLRVWPTKGLANKYRYVFSHSRNLGKVERLLWIASQARKVHSSACDDALWCIKYSSESKPRGANPFACNICLDAIRSCCPAYNTIKDEQVAFNDDADEDATFFVTTSKGNNSTPNQNFVSCRGISIYSEVLDDFSPADDPAGFAAFPNGRHGGRRISVDEFVDTY